jgi:aldehyde dehydrogenase (NAD+)
MTMVIALTHWIGESEEQGDDEVEVEDLNPSDLREVVASYTLLGAAQVTRIVDLSHAAATTWRGVPVLQRGVILLRAAAILRERKEHIADTVSRENGKTIREATVEVEKSADFFEYYGGLARGQQGRIVADVRPNTQTRVLQEPLGIVLAICPWNDPLLTPARKLAPALIAGNAVLLKPAADTPLAALMLFDALRDAGLPTGVLSTLICSHEVLEEHVLADPRLSAVSFTGSTKVGNALRLRLAARNVRVQTETGGKNAAIVMGDADLALAMSSVVAGAFAQAGQRCTATSRLIVTADIRDEFVAGVVKAVSVLVLGESTNLSTDMGPVVTDVHRRSVLDHIARAVKQGAHVVHGGTAPEAPALSHGCFVEPTVIAGVEPSMSIWCDEIFGPVLAIRSVETFDDAIAAANDSAYGLSASVFTSSLAAAERAISELDVGQVAINLPTSGWDVHHPFGGFKDSGSPFKEQGLEALRFYTRVKTAAVRYG